MAVTKKKVKKKAKKKGLTKKTLLRELTRLQDEYDYITDKMGVRNLDAPVLLESAKQNLWLAERLMPIWDRLLTVGNELEKHGMTKQEIVNYDPE